MGSKPKKPEATPARAELKDLSQDEGSSNYEKELKRAAKNKTVNAGETGGYGGSTNLS